MLCSSVNTVIFEPVLPRSTGGKRHVRASHGKVLEVCFWLSVYADPPRRALGHGAPGRGAAVPRPRALPDRLGHLHHVDTGRAPALGVPGRDARRSIHHWPNTARLPRPAYFQPPFPPPSNPRLDSVATLAERSAAAGQASSLRRDARRSMRRRPSNPSSLRPASVQPPSRRSPFDPAQAGSSVQPPPSLQPISVQPPSDFRPAAVQPPSEFETPLSKASAAGPNVSPFPRSSRAKTSRRWKPMPLSIPAQALFNAYSVPPSPSWTASAASVPQLDEITECLINQLCNWCSAEIPAGPCDGSIDRLVPLL